MSKQTFIRKNEKIRAREVRVIYNDNNLGILKINEALSKSKELGLDLVEVSPKANPPVCKIIDWGKYQYEQAKLSKNKKNTTKNHEMKFGVAIGENDLNVKVKHIIEFLEKGDSVKILISFKGRQNIHKNMGFELADTIKEKLDGYKLTDPKLNGRNIIFIAEK